MQSIEITIDECEAGEDTDATGKGERRGFGQK